MKILFPIVAGIIAGILFTWADHISVERENAALRKERDELVSDLNAYRVMWEWDRFEKGRTVGKEAK